MKLLLTTLAVALAFGNSVAQTTKDYAVRLSATTQNSPPSITLTWRSIPYGTPVYTIFKKAKDATTWSTAIHTITTGDTTYTDNSVIVDSVYEYQIYATGTSLSVNSTGYILAGIKAPAIHNRGALVLLVDSTFTDSCATEIATLMDDISGDGWQVIRHDLSRTLKDTAIKSIIKNDYSNIPDVEAVLILGHLAVPYSGKQNPDGHTNHIGAWPADAYYGSLTGVWTDVTVNDVTSANPLNHNVPGDGNWDPIAIPSGVQLQVSRVDFYNMPAFSATEVQMMRRYLNKDHAYKMDSLNVRHRALVQDNFGVMSGEAFAANGWRNFAPLVGFDSVATAPFISSLQTESYQWAYGTGGGTYTSASGIGNTANFASGSVHGIFTMLFGSYFGDWNYQNNFLRAPLCADTPALTCSWAGRPNWFVHKMAMGDNIGAGTRLTQNNTSGMYYPPNYGAGWVHVALMGDLTLRTDYIKKPSALSIVPTAASGATLSWTASPDAAVIGYYVYRTDSMWGHYERISEMITATTYIDTIGVDGLKFYMVRPVKLQATPSGNYYNLGIGITDTATVDFPVIDTRVATIANNSLSVDLFPNPANNHINVLINSDKSTRAIISLVNIAGAQLYPALKQLNSGENRYELDISSLAPGVYMLKVNTQQCSKFVKWVKL